MANDPLWKLSYLKYLVFSMVFGGLASVTSVGASVLALDSLMLLV